MRFFVVGLALLSLAAATSVSVDYLPPVQEVAAPTVEYLPPVSLAVAEEPTILSDDGYRYKTVKKLRLRRRRDVNELPLNEYLPPAQEVVEIAAPVAELAPIAPLAQSAVLADDGYRYKTVRKLRLRRRRDVNELPLNEYLPPAQEVVEIAAPVAELAPIAPLAESAVLADDGYRYKTVRKLRLRRRRDVNELPLNEYLPPAQEVVEIATPVAELAPIAPLAESAVLADDGYRYKTVRKLRLRRRRDVNELPLNEYLPPAQEVVEIAAPVAELAPIAPLAESAVLADDGYRYKTVRKLRLRRRRDVNELPLNEYLPPAQEVVEIAAPVAELAPIAPLAESAVLADDGYRYKTVRKLRLRRRRDVNELPLNEYLPPAQEVVEIAAPVAELAPIAPLAESAVLADDGYRYKTVRKLRLRRRRDVNELPLNEYLPPAQEVVEIAAPVAELAPIAPLAESAVLADDGYRYKTVRKLRLRRRRDVNELPLNEYLPPAQEVVEIAAPVAEVAPLLETAALSADGYRYKTVKKLRYRHRH